jgi:hypothetical protein
MNTVLSKNTSRVLLFNPSTDVEVVTMPPYDGNGPNPLPEDNFEIWVCVVMSSIHSGYMTYDSSGAGVIVLTWPDILNPLLHSFSYTLQLNILLHELAHIFGAGIGEYYSLSWVQDTTGTLPTSKINVNATNNSYWADKLDFKNDPLLAITYYKSTRQKYLNGLSFSRLTYSILNGYYRNGIDSFDVIKVRPIDMSGNIVVGADVQIWNVHCEYPNIPTLLGSSITNSNGVAIFDWGGVGQQHNAGNLLRLIKVQKGNVQLSKFRSIFDADLSKLYLLRQEYSVWLRGNF